MFSYELCLALGGMTRKEMVSRMDALEMMEWFAYNNLNPFGYKRTDLNAAYICSMIQNTNSKKRAKIENYLPKFYREPMSNEALEERFKLMSNHMASTNTKKEKK